MITLEMLVRLFSVPSGHIVPVFQLAGGERGVVSGRIGAAHQKRKRGDWGPLRHPASMMRGPARPFPMIKAPLKQARQVGKTNIKQNPMIEAPSPP